MLRLPTILLAALFAVLTVAAEPSENPAASTQARPPVVLVHGIGDSGHTMDCLARHLREAGWEVHSVGLKPNWGQVGLDASAEQVAAYIEESFPRGERISLVGFSMGGLVARYYLQRLGGLRRVDHFVSISAPHHGSMLAWLVPDPGCRQMRPGSAFLRDLATDAAQLGRIRFTSLWTPLDLTIIPARSSILPVGDCKRIWCLAHPLMIRQPNCIRAVGTALRG